jgi:hypothetical protein
MPTLFSEKYMEWRFRNRISRLSKKEIKKLTIIMPGARED